MAITADFDAASRTKWHRNDGATVDDAKLGCLQRIATSLENLEKTLARPTVPKWRRSTGMWLNGVGFGALNQFDNWGQIADWLAAGHFFTELRGVGPIREELLREHLHKLILGGG